MGQDMYEITEYEKQYVNQDDALVVVSFQLPRHDWYIFRFTVFRILAAMKTACQSPDAVAAVRGGNGPACSTVFNIAVFLAANDDARPLHIGICERKVCHCLTVHDIRMGCPGNPPDQESALYRIFTAEDDPLYIRAKIRKADHAASVIPALYAYIFHFQVFHPGAFPGHAAEQPYAVFIRRVNLYV